jgi:hypothetical protein
MCREGSVGVSQEFGWKVEKKRKKKRKNEKSSKYTVNIIFKNDIMIRILAIELLNTITILVPLMIRLTYLLTHGAEPILRSRQLCSHSRISQHFMEPDGSILCSQEPSTGPFPEPYQ